MLKWLFEEISWKRALLYACLMPIAYFLWCLPMEYLSEYLGWTEEMERVMGFGTHGIDMTTWRFWVWLAVFVALGEEVLFRLPLSILGRLSQLLRWAVLKISGNPGPPVGSEEYLASRRRWAAPFVLPLALLLPPLFGIAHGMWQFVFIQGVAGLMFTLLYLKCGGGMGKVVKPLLICALAHFIIDGTIFGLAILSGQTMF